MIEHGKLKVFTHLKYFYPLVGAVAGRTPVSPLACAGQSFDHLQDAQTPGLSLWSAEAGLETPAGPPGGQKGQKAEESDFKKTKDSGGKFALLYGEEVEFHLNPGLSCC